MKQTAKVTARGKYNGKPTVVEIVEYNGGLDDNEERKHGNLIFRVDNIEFDGLHCINDDVGAEVRRAIMRRLAVLEKSVIKRYLRSPSHVYRPRGGTIEAYWLAFHYGDCFDEVPEISVEGKIDTFGSPFSNEDTSHVMF